MYKDILRSIGGIDVFPVISLLIFVIFFTVMLVWTMRIDRRRLAQLSALPLEGAPDKTCSECEQCGKCKRNAAAEVER